MELRTPSRAPQITESPKIRRLGTIPGVGHEPQAFKEAVLEQLQIGELGIRAAKPTEGVLPLMAIAAWGDITRESLVSRSISSA